MKNIFKTALASIVLMVSCATDEEVVLTQSTPDTFYASIEAPATRTYADEAGKLLWTANDQITIFKGSTKPLIYKFNGETGQNYGGFTNVTPDSDDDFVTSNPLDANYAIYPHDANTTISNAGVFNFTIPATQSYAENSFGLGANVMVAVTEDKSDNNLSFKNLGGYFEFSLYGEGTTVKSIEFKGNNGENLAGAVAITASHDGNPTFEFVGEATKTLTLDCGAGVALGTEANPTTFWFVVPAMTYSNGITITITDANDKVMEKSTSKSITIERSTIQPLNAFLVETEANLPITYEWFVGVEDGNYEIDTPEELIVLSLLANGDADALATAGVDAAVTFEGQTVELTADIDLSSYCGAGVGNWTPISQFKGTLDGNNHSISGMYMNTKTSAGLFASVVGATIKDLTVQGTITRPDQASRYNVGGIAAEASSSVFENCISDVEISTSTNWQQIGVGGICGSASGSTFIACQSTANITDTIKTSSYYNYVGGIVGYMSPSGSKIIACIKTSGSVKESNTGSLTAVGGIAGFMPDGNNAYQITACYSSASVSARMPGMILGNCLFMSASGNPNISDCFYTKPAGTDYNVKGVGTDNYGGSWNGYDKGTTNVSDIEEVIATMNSSIEAWNVANPGYVCNYRYALGEGNIPKLVKQ